MQNGFGTGFLPTLMFGTHCSDQCPSYILDYISSMVKESLFSCNNSINLSISWGLNWVWRELGMQEFSYRYLCPEQLFHAQQAQRLGCEEG